MTKAARLLAWSPASAMALLLSQPAQALQVASQSSIAGSEAGAEIIVTAQKREESLQKVPISIGVLSGSMLEQPAVLDTNMALQRVTGVSVLPGQFGGSQLTVRGVATGKANFSGPSPIAFYVDGAPLGLVKSAILPDASAYDLSRVEVLRGPQGTLYGANALNGVVRILTNDPNLGKFELKVRGSIASTQSGSESYRGDLAVNIPVITDALAVRIVAGDQKLPGWIDHPGAINANRGLERYIRGKVAARPTDRLTLDASAWISRSHYDSLPTSNDRDVISTAPEPYSLDFDVYNLKAGYDLDFATLTSSSSYSKFVTNNLAVSTPTIFLTTNRRSKVYSEELVLNSKGVGPWRWSLGGFYRDATDHNLQALPPVLPAPLDWTERSRSFAFFGEVTRTFLDDRLELTGGLRYFQDRYSQDENVPSSGNPAQPLNHVAKTFKAVTPRAVVTWLPGGHSAIYASFSQGFRSGFSQTPIALRSAPTLPAVDPDRLTNYEIGTKGSLANHLLRYEAAVFYIDWKKIQLPLTVPVPGTTNINASAVANGAKASGFGAELSLDLQPTPRFSIGGAISYNGLTFDRDVLSAGRILFPKGTQNPYASKYTGNGHADYSFPLGSLKMTLSASANYLSKQLVSALSGTGVSTVRSDDVLIARASATVKAPAGWSITLYVDNLANSRALYARDPALVEHSITPQPRTIGLQLDYKM